MENIRMEIYMTVNVHIVVLCIMTRLWMFWKNILSVYSTRKMETLHCSEMLVPPTELHGVITQETQILNGKYC